MGFIVEERNYSLETLFFLIHLLIFRIMQAIDKKTEESFDTIQNELKL